jgi:hypothetical protein
MISIPDAWEGKYQVEEYEEGFKLVQTVSYEKEKEMGMLSQTEKDNLKMIRNSEEICKTEHPCLKEYQADSRVSRDMDGDGKSEEISCVFGKDDTLIVIDSREFDLRDYGVQLMTLDMEVYATDISSDEFQY